MLGKLIIVCAAAALTVGSALADTEKGQKNDAPPIAAARISLGTAVTTAEQHVQGKAVRAAYERQKGGQWVYEIEVVASAEVFDVKINADNGAVIAATVDKADAVDGDDKDD
jgi:uncharacterized membrane protein YkoI